MHTLRNQNIWFLSTQEMCRRRFRCRFIGSPSKRRIKNKGKVVILLIKLCWLIKIYFKMIRYLQIFLMFLFQIKTWLRQSLALGEINTLVYHTVIYCQAKQTCHVPTRPWLHLCQCPDKPWFDLLPEAAFTIWTSFKRLFRLLSSAGRKSIQFMLLLKPWEN